MTLELQIGQSTRFERLLTQADFDRFAALSGDDNPIHVDPEFSARSKFGRTVAHGMFLYSLICRAWGNLLPGPGSLQLEQEMIFPSPTFAGETVTVRVEVLDLPSPDLVVLGTTITRPSGETGLEGRAILRVPPTGTHQFPQPGNATFGKGVALANQEGSYKGLNIGQGASVKNTFTPEDLREYADLSGDANPVYTEPAYARQRGLEGPFLPGPLLGGLISFLLGTQLPGRGTNWLKQRLFFPSPAFPGEEITARVEITRLRPEKDLANLRTVCTNPEGKVVCEGEALVHVKDLERS